MVASVPNTVRLLIFSPPFTLMRKLRSSRLGSVAEAVWVSPQPAPLQPMLLHLHEGCAVGPTVRGPTTVNDASSKVNIAFHLHLENMRPSFSPAPDHAVCPARPLMQHRGQALYLLRV